MTSEIELQLLSPYPYTRVQPGMAPGAPRSLMDTLFDADHHGENRFLIGGLGEVG